MKLVKGFEGIEGDCSCDCLWRTPKVPMLNKSLICIYSIESVHEILLVSLCEF